MQRKPVKTTAKKSSRRSSQRKKSARVRANPRDEYRDMMAKSGIARVSRLSQDECISNIPGRVSTRCAELDLVLRNVGEPVDWRGIPLSRVIEIFGPPHIGKSTLLDQILAEVQNIGGEGVLADTEVSRDRYYVERLHVDTSALHYAEFADEQRTIENVLEFVSATVDFWKPKNIPVVIGWDALGSTPTQDERDKGIVSEKDHKPGAAAKAMRLAQRLVAPKLAGAKIAFVICNHEYDKIQTGFGGGGFGKKRETYGGHGTRHMASLRIQLYNKGQIKRSSDGWVVGHEVGAKTLKNRNGEALREAIIPMITGHGAENIYTILKDLQRRGLATSSGSWSAINIDGVELAFQGWLGLRQKCNEIPELEAKLLALYERLNYADLSV